MTTEENKQYNKLSADNKEEYHHLQKKHPDWTHKQIMAKLAFDIQIESAVNGGKDVKPEDPIILVEIFKKAKDFLKNIGCRMVEVYRKIDYFVDSFTDAIAKGLSRVVKSLTDKFWQWIR